MFGEKGEVPLDPRPEGAAVGGLVGQSSWSFVSRIRSDLATSQRDPHVRRTVWWRESPPCCLPVSGTLRKVPAPLLSA